MLLYFFNLYWIWLTCTLSHRMTFKMYAVDFCELLLFDEHKQAYHMVQHAFEKKDALQAFTGYVQQLG